MWVSAFEKVAHPNFYRLLAGTSWPFYVAPNLVQIITYENVMCVFFAPTNVLKYLFLQCFSASTKFCPKMRLKNDNFSHFVKHRSLKKTFVATPSLDKKLVCFNLSFAKTKNTDVYWTKTHHKIRKRNEDKKKGVERENKTEKQKKQKGLMKKLSNLVFDFVLCMKTKAKKEGKNKEKKQGNKREQKTKRRRKGKRRDRRRKRDWKRGRENN